MINFRFHIVSLTAVFLALVIGVAMGTTVVSKATVDGLKSNLNAVEARSDRVSATNAQLRKSVQNADRQNDALTDQMLEPTVRDVLTDAPVLVIANKGIDRSDLEAAITSLTSSGAEVDGTLQLNDRLLLKGDNAKRLAEVLNVDASKNVKSIMIARLAKVLASAALVPGTGVGTSTTTSEPAASDPAASVPPVSEPTSEAPQSPETLPGTNENPGAPSTTAEVPSRVDEPDLITALRLAGFLDFRPSPGRPSTDKVLTRTEYRYVVLSGAGAEIDDSVFLEPLIVSLAKLGPIPMVAASAATGNDPNLTRDAFIGPLLANPGMKGKVSTVDNLETFSGLVSLVYALRDVALGRYGQYGLGADATSVVPNPS